MPSVKSLIEGYGEDFPGLDELLAIEANEEDISTLEAPIPGMGRYQRSVKFLQDVTSQKAVSTLRFKVITEYFISLSEELEKYTGKFADKKIVDKLSPEDKAKIRKFGTTPSEILQAEFLEKFSDHDTAAATDLIKILIGTNLPHLEPMMEGVHFPNTSEDVMGPVFGMVANNLVYGHFVPLILDFCEHAINYVRTWEKESPLVMPGLTHQQGAEPTTLGKKFMTRINAIDYLIRKMMDNDGFEPFSGKLSGAVGNFTTHYAAYPDIDWQSFAKKFVEGLGLQYDPLTDQSVSYVVEASHFTNIGNMLTQVIKLTDDFVDNASCPAQLFVKKKKKGQKGSSIMPNKSNAWGMEGAIKMLTESRENLFTYAKELPSYPHEGDMGRSYLFRNIGNVFMPAVIGIRRIMRELNSYNPNPEKIKAFFNEYPGMAGSSIQSILKRERIEGDAYRILQDISINPDGTYANATQFKNGLETAMETLDLSPELRTELVSKLDQNNLIEKAAELAEITMDKLEMNITIYRQKLEKYA